MILKIQDRNRFKLTRPKIWVNWLTWCKKLWLLSKICASSLKLNLNILFNDYTSHQKKARQAIKKVFVIILVLFCYYYRTLALLCYYYAILFYTASGVDKTVCTYRLMSEQHRPAAVYFVAVSYQKQ